jgi:Uma2 family endonuclease
MATVLAPMTTEELLAIPEDGVDRWPIEGKLRARPMTRSNRFHSRVMVRLARFVDFWLDDQPEPRVQIRASEAGIILHRKPDTTGGMDVAYVGAEVVALQTDDSTQIEVVPILVSEILSPCDTIEDVNEKIDVYLGSGVQQVWIIDPYFRTERVHRPHAEPELSNIPHELTAEPHLPGFRVAGSRLFD